MCCLIFTSAHFSLALRIHLSGFGNKGSGPPHKFDKAAVSWHGERIA